MSGTWSHLADDIAYELFGGSTYPSHSYLSTNMLSQIVDSDPMGDHEVSEMVFDVLCLLNAKDYHDAGDIGDSTYSNELSCFRAKWLDRRHSAKDSASVKKNDP